jgi:hypothetical protein
MNLSTDTITGICHGDLTLGNILVKDHELYYIDFLPIFFESPIQDIIKIRQDTRDFWSLYLLTQNYTTLYQHNIKIIEILKTMDSIIYSEFKDIINTEIYKILEIINYLRLIPYTKSQTTLIYINSIIGKLECIL